MCLSFLYQQVSHESGFVVSSSSQEANSVNEDPMVQQMNNLRGYIQQAREANMFDEVSMLESNLRMLQEEFKRQKEEEAVAAANQRVNDLSLEEASNPFSEEPSNPFSQESSNPFSQVPRSLYDVHYYIFLTGVVQPIF